MILTIDPAQFRLLMEALARIEAVLGVPPNLHKKYITIVGNEVWIYTDEAGTLGPASMTDALCLPIKDSKLFSMNKGLIEVEGYHMTSDEFFRRRGDIA